MGGLDYRGHAECAIGRSTLSYLIVLMVAVVVHLELSSPITDVKI